MSPSKLPSSSLEKKAVVYVRQSTTTQLRENLESQRPQYDLVELAREYGFREVEVIDDDMGLSGSGTVERPGFEHMVGSLCAGTIGAVFCLEASRLARNGRDWHRLLELCGLVGARVVDTDGAYDPSLPNDRLLLGMKGTISEFELGVLRSRMNEALWAKARRGELRISVPIGYVWERGVDVGLDPDLRVQEFVHLVFQKFREKGSARQVLLWMQDAGVHGPRPSDAKSSTAFVWRLPRYRSVISILKNPFYAGAYTYGKSKHRTDILAGRPRKSYGHAKPREEWTVFIQNHHKGYIDWTEYERNQDQLARNNFCRREGPSKSARGGRALLAGLLRCRECGLRLQVVYCGRGAGAPRYRCDRPQLAYGLERCMSFGTWLADQAIAREVMRVVQPLALEAAMEAERQREQKQASERRVLELELERARYEARLAERRYAACDPENRLVASQLEAHWEQAMLRVRTCEDRFQTVDASPASPVGQGEDLLGLALDLEAAWSSPTTSMRVRQRLLRALIEEIVVEHDEEARQFLLVIHWKGGQHSEVRVRKLRTGEHRNRAPEEALELIRSMAGRWPDDQIAATLNRMQLKTGQGNTWDQRRVRAVRSTHNIRAYKSAEKGSHWMTMSQAAQHLGVTNHIIRRLIRTGILAAEQVVPRAPYQIRVDDLESSAVQNAISRRPCRIGSEDSLPLFPTTYQGGAQ